MGIVTSTPRTPPKVAVDPVTITAPSFQGVTVDTKYEPIQNLLTHIEGSSWTVNYYSQVLGRDNALSPQSLDRSAVVQQYRLIQEFELKVTTPLNTTQDQETKEMILTGQANVYPRTVVPNEGDHFIADVGDGREAIFMITSSEQRSIYKDAAYIVDYTLVAYSDQDGRIDDLNSKVVENLYYEADFHQNGQNPLITYDAKLQLEKLREAVGEMIAYYFRRFYSKEFRLLLLPGQDYAIYDPFLTKSVLSMFRDTDDWYLKRIRDLNVGEDDNYEIPNVWTAFINKRRADLRNCMRSVWLVAARQFSPDPMMDSLRYSGIDYTIYPADPDKSEDYLRHDKTKIKAGVSIKPTLARSNDLEFLLKITELYGLPYDAPVISPYDPMKYVFSDAFYNNDRTGGQSALELAVQDYLDDKALNLPLILKLTTTYPQWGALDQFYQLPFLIGVARAAIRRM